MAELRVPKLNNNDAEYLLVEWLVPDGAQVHEDDAVVLVETSKATEELPADATGVLRYAVAAGDWCKPDQVIATVTAPGSAAQEPAPATGTGTGSGAAPASGTGIDSSAGPDLDAGPASGVGAGPLITAPAQALIDELGIPLDRVKALGVPVVRRSDVERLVSGTNRQPLSKVQRGVARAVELSRQTIPAAYTVVHMDLGPALRYAEEQTALIRRPVGLAEVFVEAVAGLHGDFPLFFAAIDGDHAVLAPTPDLGVTLDLGAGLFVPVLHDAGARTLKDIASTLMRHRLSAAEGEFTSRELAGANFVITLHTEGDVVLAVPLVFPGTACALAVTAPHDGTRAYIGLAYDHRLINGRDATLFLGALKSALESRA
ncbi:dehydrogenase [Nonomuraea sp. NN258]|uniref:2-oxo acid dehydrogenase subunit E2 n=1 Tax=Nonomuraea antri TaxID=2730852 RepID=UPI00156A5F40|nr:2-oxo acid dehydrogenase subunit E2 [Nonomuraea antri]NRQ32580.1 dehydrogenase [Nonomuraea antri]